MIQNTFRDFLIYTSSQKEVSLAVAKDAAEESDFVSVLNQHGFQKVDNLVSLLNAVISPSKVFYQINEALPQEMYEFISQYPTKHMSIFDKALGDFRISKPRYVDVSVVFLVTVALLDSLAQKGISIFDKAGLVYQS